MLIAILMLLSMEARVGGAVVCAEARGLKEHEQIAVGAVVRERVRQSGRSGVEELTRPLQFARPCLSAMVEAVHVERYVIGRLGLGPAWTHGLVGFYARRLDDRLRERWQARGWERVDVGGRHVYWRGAL